MKRKLFLSLITVGLIIYALAKTNHFFSGGLQLQTVVSEGHERSYLVHDPKSTDTQKNKSVVIVFHGAGDTAANIASRSGLNNFSDKYGFVVVYPESYISSWADGRGVAPEDAQGIHDTQFARDLVLDLEKKYKVDPFAISAAGFSSGGFLVHRLACEDADMFKSFVAIGAGFPSTLNGSCTPSKARSFLLVFGTADQSYLGSYTNSGVQVGSFDQTLVKRAQINQCSNPISNTVGVVENTIYANCKDGTTISGISVAGAGHSWIRQSDFDVSATIVDTIK